jgi:hypothetical protein
MINKDLLIRRRIPKGGSEECLWHFISDAQRVFEIRQFGRSKFLLSEFRPNGVISESSNKGTTFDRTRLSEAGMSSVAPNDFADWLSAKGISIDTVMREVPRLSLESYFYESIEDTLCAIEQAIDDNTWYEKRQEVTAEALEIQRSEALVDRVQFWSACQASLDAAKGLPGLFKGCHSMMGPLSADAQRAVLSYVNNPSHEGWLSIRNTLITTNTTIWAAYTRMSGKTNRIHAGDFPGSDAIKRAIRNAIAQWQEEVTKKLQAALSETELVSRGTVLEVISGLS